MGKYGEYTQVTVAAAQAIKAASTAAGKETSSLKRLDRVISKWITGIK